MVWRTTDNVPDGLYDEAREAQLYRQSVHGSHISLGLCGVAASAARVPTTTTMVSDEDEHITEITKKPEASLAVALTLAGQLACLLSERPL